MGLNCVAVLLNDWCHDLEKDGGAIGVRLSRAMQDWSPGELPAFFRVGSIISRDHADGYQITVVHGNTGRPIYACGDLPRNAQDQLAKCLRRHGWTARAPSKQNSQQTATE